MIIPCLRKSWILGLFSVCALTSSAQVITIDLSNLSAVTFTATGANSAINYGPGALTFDDGIALLSFFTAPVAQDVSLGSISSNTFGPTLNSPNYFGQLDTWDDSDPDSSTDSVGTDITFWTDGGDTDFEFTTGSTAFSGTVTLDLSGYANTNLFPSNGASGNVVIWNGNGTIGTWQVSNSSAVPEPSTYATLAGLMAIAVCVVGRRRSKVDIS